MSAAGTHTKEERGGGGGGRAKGREQGEHRGEDGWHEKRRKKKTKTEGGEGAEEGFALGNQTSHQRDEIYSVMFLSDNNQFGQKVTLQA